MTAAAVPIHAPARLRVLIDNDFSGDPDGLVQLAHHLLSPSVEIVGIIGSHLAPGDAMDASDTTADNAVRRIHDVVDALGQTGRHRIVAGSNAAMADAASPVDSAAARAIVEEAMRESELPLFLCAGAGLTEVASAWLLEPRIAERLTLVWIGGPEDPTLASPPPGASPVEYNLNLNIDITAAQLVFNESDIPIWQVPRNAYRQTLLSAAEQRARVRPHGAIGALLADSIDRVIADRAAIGQSLGETYIYGDSPLVLLTALQSAFEADPSSSEWASRPAPRVRDDGTVDFGGTADSRAAADSDHPGRDIRVFTRLDNRLMFEDLFAKLAAAAAAAGPSAS